MKLHAHCAAILLMIAKIASASPLLHITTDRTVIPVGTSVVVSVHVTNLNYPRSAYRVYPLVNGHIWGSGTVTDTFGRGAFSLPIPWLGNVQVSGYAIPVGSGNRAHWVWVGSPHANQTVYIAKRFILRKRPRNASMLITCDDSGTVWINGRRVINKTNSLFNVSHINAASYLSLGTNTIAISAHNDVGPAGVLAELKINSSKIAVTDNQWIGWLSKPIGWPLPHFTGANRVISEAAVGHGIWANGINGWPGIQPAFYVGSVAPANVIHANSVAVRTTQLDHSVSKATDLHKLIVMDWEPWFTVQNATWNTAEAIPIIGQYASDNAEVIRQHLLWLHYIGVNAMMVDWSNNLNSQPTFNLSAGVKQIVHATDTLFRVATLMRKQGYHVPRIFFLLGVNGLADNTTAENKQIQFIRRRYLSSRIFGQDYCTYRGRPLVVILNGHGPAYQASQKPLDDTGLTVRWMWTQDQQVHYNRVGYWSWMDGCLNPLITYLGGSPEAMTITPAFFAPEGWTKPGTYGRLNGWTYVTQWANAVAIKPAVLLINQWNEFAGQGVGDGYGANHDRYVDTYSRELSDDIEPTSLHLPGIRSNGGWGYQYLNLTRAGIRILTGADRSSTVMAVRPPSIKTTAKNATIAVAWFGRRPSMLLVFLDKRRIARVACEHQFKVKIPHLAPGRHTLTILAPGRFTEYPLFRSREDQPLSAAVPAKATVTFIAK